MTKRKKRLCIIVHPPIALTLLRKQWLYWIDNGYEVSCISGPSTEEHDKITQMGVKSYVIPMERYPSLLKDVVSLTRIWWVLMRNRFDIVHVSVLKASLLGSLAARLSGHRRLVYLVRGRTYENMTGLKRKFYDGIEWLICHLAARVIPICSELGDLLVEAKHCPCKKINFIGSGSSAGIDLSRFTRTDENMAAGREIRERFGIAPNDVVILFVGWLRKDKGVNELVDAYNQLADTLPKLHLLLLGNFEPTDPLRPETNSLIENHPRIHHMPWQVEPAPVYTAADIMAFPSYREGFGNVAMEASAMELPVVASDIMGCREAVKKDYTGLLVPVADSASLTEALKTLIDNPEMRQRLARNGRERVENEFSQELIWEGNLKIFEELLKT